MNKNASLVMNALGYGVGRVKGVDWEQDRPDGKDPGKRGWRAGEFAGATLGIPFGGLGYQLGKRDAWSAHNKNKLKKKANYEQFNINMQKGAVATGGALGALSGAVTGGLVGIGVQGIRRAMARTSNERDQISYSKGALVGAGFGGALKSLHNVSKTYTATKKPEFREATKELYNRIR